MTTPWQQNSSPSNHGTFGHVVWNDKPVASTGPTASTTAGPD
jgi:hypothetical protein